MKCLDCDKNWEGHGKQIKCKNCGSTKLRTSEERKKLINLVDNTNISVKSVENTQSTL